MEDSCSCCISLSWAELVVQALAPIPTPTNTCLPPSKQSQTRHSYPPPWRRLRKRYGGKDKPHQGICLTDHWLLFGKAAQHIVFLQQAFTLTPNGASEIASACIVLCFNLTFDKYNSFYFMINIKTNHRAGVTAIFLYVKISYNMVFAFTPCHFEVSMCIY